VELAGLKSERSQTMTDTIDDVAAEPVEQVPAEPSIDEQSVAEQLVAQARAKGIELVGPDGLLTSLTKRVLEAANVIALGFLLESISTKCEPGGVSSSGDPAAASGPRSASVEEGETTQVDDVADSGRPFETVRIQGTYRGGADTLLRVQRWEKASGWPSRCPRGPTNRASSLLMSSLGSRGVTGFACWTRAPA
jgi:hypothetical protein